MNRKDLVYSTKLKNINPINLLFGTDNEADNESLTDNKMPINTIPTEVIKLSPNQPRKYFDHKKLEALSLSIKEIGILEPLIVRPLSDGYYELIAGERRLKAAILVGIEEIPVVIKDMDDNLVKQVQLVENLQREDLNAYEETIGILELLALRLNKTQEDVISLLNWMEKSSRKQADKTIQQEEEWNSIPGENNSLASENISADNVIRQCEKQVVETVFISLGRLSANSFRANRLPLLNLPQDIQEVLQKGVIEYTKARAIAKVKDIEARSLLLQIAIEKNLSLAEIQQRIQDNSQQKKLDTTPQLKTRYKELSKQLGASKIWDDPAKKKSLEKLLDQIKALLDG